MGNLIQPLVALLFVFMQGGAVESDTSLEEVLPSSVAALLAFALVVWWTSRGAARAWEAIGRPGGRFRFPMAVSLLHLFLFGLLVFLTPWVSCARALAGGIPVLSGLVAFLPFAWAQVARALADHGTLPEERRKTSSRGDAVVFSLRVLALPAIPLLILDGVRDAILRHPTLGPLVEAYLPLLVGVILALMFVVFALSPLLARLVIGAKPLGPGPLRDRLQAYDRKTGFRPSAVLVWKTGHAVTNALFIGILPFLRYVVLTDALIARLDDAEVEAVYAHEIGHGRRRHTILYLVFAAGFTLFTLGLQENLATLSMRVGEGLAGFFGTDSGFPLLVQYLTLFTFSAVSLVGFFVGFGWMSRRFETEADIHAVRTIDAPEDFPRALEAVGLHAGVLNRRGGGLRHFGIGQRIGLLNRYLNEPGYSGQFDRVIRRCRGVIIGFFVISLAWFAIGVPGMIVDGDLALGYRLLMQSRENNEAARAERALALARSYAMDHADPSGAGALGFAALSQLADLELGGGHYEAAARRLKEMDSGVFEEDRLGAFNHRHLQLVLMALRDEAEPTSVREVISLLDDLTSGMSFPPESVAETWSDLYLMMRIAGESGSPPGQPGRYAATAALLLRAETARAERARGRTPRRPSDLDRLLRETDDEPRYRVDLFERATGGIAPRELARETWSS